MTPFPVCHYLALMDFIVDIILVVKHSAAAILSSIFKPAISMLEDRDTIYPVLLPLQ
jgi:hypothetical protein